MSNGQAEASAIFANGIWKSGNHLLIKLCDMLGYPLAGAGIAASSINGRLRLVRKLMRGSLLESNSVNIGLEQPVQVSKQWLKSQCISVQGCTLGGHAAYSDDLVELLKRQKMRMIQIVRDPRDLVLSYAKWISTRKDEYWYQSLAPLSIEERTLNLINGFDSKKGYFSSLATVLDRSSGWLNQPEVLVVRYENLVGKEGGGTNQAQLEELTRVINWLGVKSADIDWVQKSLFGGTKTFHSGQIGAWRNSFTQDHLRIFRELVGQTRMQEWGYD